MVLFSSFAPTGGSIKKVSVYQSEFGKKKMEEELINGPVEILKIHLSKFDKFRMPG